MAKKRAKRFDEGGDVGTYDYASLGKREPKMDKEALDRFNKAMDDRRDRESNQGDVNAEFARKLKDLNTGDKTASFKAEPGEGEAEPVKPIRQADRIVSKKELADSGLTLREFLNRERKLKPRGAATPKKTAEISMETSVPVSKSARTSKEEIADIVTRTPLKNPSGGFDILNALRRNQEVGGATMKESGRQARVDRLRRNVGTNQETYGMKKGGKVSSASSRGDGIAQRGKTKGRII
jgi:hypothetical protein